MKCGKFNPFVFIYVLFWYAFFSHSVDCMFFLGDFNNINDMR